MAMTKKWVKEAERQLRKAKRSKVFESKTWREKACTPLGYATAEEVRDNDDEK